MDPDLTFVVGAVLLVLAIPSLFSAFADSRPPRTAALVLLIGGGMVAVALGQKPDGLVLSDIPNIFFRVIARILN